MMENGKRAWRDPEQNCSYFYQTNNGLIIGQVYNLAHTKIWGAKVSLSKDPNDELSLGHYINVQFACKAVEEYWDIQERTLIGT